MEGIRCQHHGLERGVKTSDACRPGSWRRRALRAVDATFQPVVLAADAFHDRRLPAGYAPFNVQAVG